MTKAGRIKTTYIVLVGLIVILSLYLGLRSGDKVQYTIPALPALTGIDEVTIEQPGATIDIALSGGVWLIRPEGYAADPDALKQVINTVSNPQITDLVSVTGNYGVYDLEESSRIRVSAYIHGEMVRAIDFGRRSPTYGHTFAKIDGDDRIFQIAGDIRPIFANSKEGFRDKTALSFDQRTIAVIRIQGSGESVDLVRDDAGSSWKTRGGETWNSEAVDEALGTLSSLRVYNYRNVNDNDGDVVMSIELKGEEDYYITFYEKQGNFYPVRSSQSRYPFTLFYVVSENIMQAFR